MYNKIHAADCLDFMKSIPDNTFDMSFADPPFNLGKQYDSANDKVAEVEYLGWSKKWLWEMVRVTKGTIFVHNIPKWSVIFAKLLSQTNAEFKHWIAWNAPSSPMGKSLQPTHYCILYYKKKDAKFYEVRHPHHRCRECEYLFKDYGGKVGNIHPFGPLVGDVWFDLHRVRHRSSREDHPCQLPVPLLERLILMSTDENDLVFDPFVGTGTTAIAAKKLGRVYYGCDLSKKYVETATNIIKKTDKKTFYGFFVSRHNNKIVTIRDRDWKKMSNYFDVPSNKSLLNVRSITPHDELI